MGHRHDPWVCGRASHPACTTGQSRTGQSGTETGLTLEVKDVCRSGDMPQPCGYRHRVKRQQGSLGLTSRSLQNQLESRQVRTQLSSKRSGYSEVKP